MPHGLVIDAFGPIVISHATFRGQGRRVLFSAGKTNIVTRNCRGADFNRLCKCNSIIGRPKTLLEHLCVPAQAVDCFCSTLWSWRTRRIASSLSFFLFLFQGEEINCPGEPHGKNSKLRVFRVIGHADHKG